MDSEVPKELMASESTNYLYPDCSSSAMQIDLIDPIPNDLRSQSLFLSNMPMRQVDGLQKFLLPSQPRGMEYLPSNMGLKTSSLPAKRKAPVDILASVSKQSPIFIRHDVEMEHRPWLHQVSPPSKRFAHLLSLPPGPVIPQSRRTQRSSTPRNHAAIINNYPKFQNESYDSGTPRSSTPRNHAVITNSSPKFQKEPYDSVRSKMRDSLSAALALVSQKPDTTINGGKNSLPETDKTVEHQDNIDTASVEVGPDGIMSEKANGAPFPKEKASPDKTKGENTSQKVFEGLSETLGYDRLQFQTSNILPYEEISFDDNFFSKDELLQGNGLSWVLDSDMQMAERNEIQFVGKQKLEEVDVVEEDKKVQSPGTLATKIEMELFNLFGGVNKKYKEKGRSLLFNLKDPNNPELRERVMYGDIPPERLCSMTVEELASKELSQWRMAKAEELAQMVVLPESEVDIRRLVRKTHKGEFQVEVEQSDNVPLEVSAGASAFAKSESNNNGTEGPSPDKDELNAVSTKDNREDKDVPYELALQPNEGTDLMQGLIVDDSLKDVEFLPPIISLDEFMLSLQSEPPFENLSSATRKSGDIELVSDSKSSSLLPKHPVNTTPEKSEKTDEARIESDADVKSVDDHSSLQSNDNHAGGKSSVGDADFRSRGNDIDLKIGDEDVKSDKTSLVNNMPKVEYFWKGLLQLNTSSTISIAGVFKGGEKATAKEWPGSLEIKGRVRVDAFEKFLHGLPLSRSRAFMVVHFDLKEETSENERATLVEVVDSYVSDQRVGFAEVSSGVEIYFCPPRKPTLEMLHKNLPKRIVECLDSIDAGLIGFVVWKKPQSSSTISPNSSHHHKHTSKRQHSSSRRQTDSSLNVDSPKQRIPAPSFPRPDTTSQIAVSVNDDDNNDHDVPPGFGPEAPREDDDLPEFNFSASIPQISTQTTIQRSSMPSLHPLSETSPRPVEKIRELIYKYGQSESHEASGLWTDKRVVGGGAQFLNDDDDDDDIPEWQPQAPQYKSQVAQPLQGFELAKMRMQEQQLRSAQQLLPHHLLAPAIGRHQGSQWPQFYREANVPESGQSGMTWPHKPPQSSRGL